MVVLKYDYCLLFVSCTEKEKSVHIFMLKTPLGIINNTAFSTINMLLSIFFIINILLHIFYNKYMISIFFTVNTLLRFFLEWPPALCAGVRS